MKRKDKDNKVPSVGEKVLAAALALLMLAGTVFGVIAYILQ